MRDRPVMQEGPRTAVLYRGNEERPLGANMLQARDGRSHALLGRRVQVAPARLSESAYLGVAEEREWPDDGTPLAVLDMAERGRYLIPPVQLDALVAQALGVRALLLSRPRGEEEAADGD